MDGLAHSLTIGGGGRLDHYASSALRMHTRWARGRHGDSVGDDTYRDALDVATSLHTALIVDRRGAHIPGAHPGQYGSRRAGDRDDTDTATQGALN